jgi:hypothetical protein
LLRAALGTADVWIEQRALRSGQADDCHGEVRCSLPVSFGDSERGPLHMGLNHVLCCAAAHTPDLRTSPPSALLRHGPAHPPPATAGLPRSVPRTTPRLASGPPLRHCWRCRKWQRSIACAPPCACRAGTQGKREGTGKLCGAQRGARTGRGGAV